MKNILIAVEKIDFIETKKISQEIVHTMHKNGYSFGYLHTGI